VRMQGGGLGHKQKKGAEKLFEKKTQQEKKNLGKAPKKVKKRMLEASRRIPIITQEEKFHPEDPVAMGEKNRSGGVAKEGWWWSTQRHTLNSRNKKGGHNNGPRKSERWEESREDLKSNRRTSLF